MKSISVDEAKKLVRDGEVLILDVRTPMENMQSRIKNSVLIPLNQLESRINEILGDKPILVYCRSGNRSLFAAHILERHGFRKVLNLREGIIECPFECIETDQA